MEDTMSGPVLHCDEPDCTRPAVDKPGWGVTGHWCDEHVYDRYWDNRPETNPPAPEGPPLDRCEQCDGEVPSTYMPRAEAMRERSGRLLCWQCENAKALAAMAPAKSPTPARRRARRETGPAEERVSAAFRRHGQDFQPGVHARCLVPNHGQGRGDLRPSLSVTVNDTGVGLVCRVGCSLEAIVKSYGLTVPELFNNYRNAAENTRRDPSTQEPKSPSTKENMRQPAANDREEGGEKGREQEMDHLLGLHAAGRIDVDVELPPLPVGMPEPHREVLAFFGLCVALRRWADMEEPYEVRFSRRWVAKWTGHHEQTVKRAIVALQRPQHPLATAGLLMFVRETEPRRDRDQAHGTSVFAPGWLVDAEEVSAALPAKAGSVEPDDARGVHEGEPVSDDAAVFEAEVGDGREVLERDDGRGAPFA